jgi:hypothetical protein
MSNPYVGTPDESTWDQGYNYGWYNPEDTEPTPPAALTDSSAVVYREGALAGRDGAAAYAADPGGGGMTSAAGPAEAQGTEPLSSEPGPVTIPEVTVTGDPNSPTDPNSADDAYADGYNAGYRGGGPEDSSGYADAVKPWYHKGWSEGYALRLTEEQHSGAGEVAHGVGEVAVPVIMDHWVLHGILKGLPITELIAHALSPGGDTVLATQLVYWPVCHREEHGLSGDAVFDGGAWHGTLTTDDSLARSEGDEHGSSWDHADSIHVWSYNRDDDLWTMED